MPDDLDRFLPLKHAHYMILLTLTEGDMHGYALKKRIEERTEGRTRLGAGSLYRSIGQLQEAGLVAPSDWRPAPALDDDRREYLHLTDLGRRVAGAETDRLASLVASARAAGLGGGA
ncbi:MAG: PadR family transcriptional regulator [Longimicrobiales bacterium]